MAEKVRADVAQVAATGSSIGDIAGQIGVHVQAIGRAIQDLTSSGWQGDAAKQAMQFAVVQRDRANRLLTTLARHGEATSQASIGMDAQEQSAARQLAGIAAELNGVPRGRA
jgi:hypothetical protein